MGDVLAALLVFAGTTAWVLQPRGFAAINALLVVVWLVLAWRVGHYYQRLTTAGVAPSSSDRALPNEHGAAPAAGPA
jgi:fatty acid desaturase